MAADVIGTAQVVIRAITTGLQKDIERGIKKSVDDASPAIDDEGKRIGESLGSGAGDAFDVDVGGTVSDTVDKAIPDLEKSGEKAGSATARGHDRSFSRDLNKNTKKTLSDFDKKFKKSLGEIFKGIKIPLIAWAGVLGIPAIGGAVKIISNYIVGLVGQLGFLSEAAIGAGVVLGTAFAGLITGIAPLFLFLKKKSPELDAFKAALKEQGTAWNDLARSIQRQVFPELLVVTDLLTRKLMPSIRVLSKLSANTAVDFLHMAGAILTSSRNVRFLNTFIGASSQIFRVMSRVVLRVVDILLPLLATAGPLAVQFAEALDRVVAKFQTFIRSSADSGKLSETLTLWYVRSVQFFNALIDISVAIKNVFKIGAEAATPFFDTLSRNAEHWRKLTETAFGQQQIKRFFDNATPVMREVNLLLRDIIAAILTPIAGGDNSGIIKFLELIRTVLLPALIELSKAVSKSLTDALLQLSESFVKFIGVAAKSGALHTFFNVLSDLFIILSELLSLPGVSTLVASLFAIAAGLRALNIVTLGFSSKALAAIVSNLVRFALAAPLFTELGAALQLLFEAMLAGEGVGTALGLLGGALAPFAIVIIAVAAAIAEFALVWKFWDTIKETLGPVGVAILAFISPIVLLVAILKEWRSILSFFADIPGLLAGAADALGSFFSDLPGIVGDALSATGDFLGRLPGIIGDALSSIGGIITDAFLTGVGALISALPGMFSTVVNFFARLPANILRGLATLSGFLIGRFARILLTLAVALPRLAAGIGEFFQSLPGQIIDLLGPLVGQLGEFAAGLFVDFIQALPGAVARVIGFFIRLPGQIIDALSQILPQLPTLAGGIFSGFLDALTGAAPAVLDFFTALPGQIIAAVPAAATWLAGLGSDIIGGLLQGILDAAVNIVSFVGELVQRFIDAFEEGFGISSPATELIPIGFDILMGVLQGMLNAIPLIATFLASLPLKVITFIGNVATTLVQKGVDFFAGLLTGLVQKLADVASFLGGLALRVLQFVGNVEITLVQKGIDLIGGLLSGIVQAAVNVFNFFSQIPSTILGAIPDVSRTLFDIGVSLLQGFLDGLNSMLGTILDFFGSLADKAVDLLTHPWDIFSPSKVFARIGKNVLLGLVDGLQKTEPQVERAFNSVVATVNDAMTRATRPVVVPVTATVTNVLADTTAPLVVPVTAKVTSQFTPSATLQTAVAALTAAPATGEKDLHLDLTVVIGEEERQVQVVVPIRQSTIVQRAVAEVHAS